MHTQAVHYFVGSLESINPRHFRLLVSDVPQRRVLHREGTLIEAGIFGFTLIIPENTKVRVGDAIVLRRYIQICRNN